MIKGNRRYSYEEIMDAIKLLQRKYPSILKYNYIGMSSDRRPIASIRMGKGSRTLFCIGGVHGRESVNPVVMLRMIETYCEAYSTGQELVSNVRWSIGEKWNVCEILSEYQILWIPLVNPDGYEVAARGFEMLRNQTLRENGINLNISHEEWKLNGNSIDINRNFPCKFYEPVHKGDYPGSEPETQMLQKIFKGYDGIGLLDFHSRGKQIYYYRSGLPDSYNEEKRQEALYLQKFCGYRISEPEEEMADQFSGGNTVQYYAVEYQKTAITIETVSDEETFPFSPMLQQETFDEIVHLPVALLDYYRKQQ